MDRFDPKKPLPEDLRSVEGLLREHRPTADALELDRVKLRAIAQSPGRAAPRVGARRPMTMPARGLVPIVVAAVLMTSGAAVIVGSKSPKGSFSTGSAASSQYCPQPANGPPKAKNGKNKCGQ